MTRRIRTWAEATEPAGAVLAQQVDAQHERLRARMASVRAVVAVASGKGGVGKSFIAANLAAALGARGQRVGALDADLNGPCLAAMLAAARTPLRVTADGVAPARARDGCVVMSSDLLLERSDSPLQWHGPDAAAFAWQSTLETGMLREFLSDVAWGQLDVLVVDLPPGTDRIMRALSLLPRLDLLLMVTTPSRAANAVVARALTCVRDAHVTRVGVVRNMATLVCSGCGGVTPLFSGRSEADAEVSWVSVPFDAAAAEATDRGEPLPPASPVTRAVAALATRVQGEIAIAQAASP